MVYVSFLGSLEMKIDLHLGIEEQARRVGLSPPSPLLFGDSNWTTYLFGCALEPGSGKLALWRFEPNCSRGVPMTAWNCHFGFDKKAYWTLYPGLNISLFA